MRRIKQEALKRQDDAIDVQYVRFKTVLGPFSLADVDTFNRHDKLSLVSVPVYSGCFAATPCGHYYPEVILIDVRESHVRYHQQRAYRAMLERWDSIAPYLKSPSLLDPKRLQGPTLTGHPDETEPHVYILKDSTDPLRDRIKIGATTDVQRRIGEIVRTYDCDANKVELITVIPYAGYKLEKQLHKTLQNYVEPDCRGGHEWFSYTDYVKAVVSHYLIA